MASRAAVDEDLVADRMSATASAAETMRIGS